MSDGDNGGPYVHPFPEREPERPRVAYLVVGAALWVAGGALWVWWARS